MFTGHRLLTPLLLLATLLLALRALRPPPPLGRPAPSAACEVPVAAADGAVACLTRSDAARRGLRAGDGLAAASWAGWAIPVDVNRASPAELASLDGIGPALARRIVAARPFRSVDDVARVRGIGPRRLARLRPRLVLDGP